MRCAICVALYPGNVLPAPRPADVIVSGTSVCEVHMHLLVDEVLGAAIKQAEAGR